MTNNIPFRENVRPVEIQYILLWTQIQPSVSIKLAYIQLRVKCDELQTTFCSTNNTLEN